MKLIPTDEKGKLITYWGGLEKPKQETLEDFINEQLEGYDEIDFSTYETFIELGAKWQQEKDNKELAMWKLAVEKQEARCTALRSIISDLQERSYSEEDMAESFMACWKANVPEGFECKLSFNELFEQFKKK